MPLPNFLIVGAMKAGTTSLVRYLAQHPEVFLPPREVHFFDEPAHFEQGADWYAAHFDGAEGIPAVGEKTPTYCISPAAPARIAGMLPDARMIWLFRDPVARTYSNYWHAVHAGDEEASFEQAVAKDEERRQQDIFHAYCYRSLYPEQVRRYLQRFKREQMLFLLFEDLVRTPQPLLEEVCGFIGADPSFDFQPLERAANQTHRPLSRRYARWVNRRFGRNTRLSHLLNQLNRRPASGYPPMKPQTAEKLAEYFRPYNEELAALTGLDLSVWKKG